MQIIEALIFAFPLGAIGLAMVLVVVGGGRK